MNKEEKKHIGVLVSFTVKSERFHSNYERNRFYRGLYGWTQIIRKKEIKYEYKREGLLNEIPHIKVDNSVFIVALNEFKRILKYLKEWEDKVEFQTFKVLLTREQYKKLKRKVML